MIQVEAATAVALRQPTVKLTPRIRWLLQGGSIDVSERIDTFPGIQESFLPYLGGYQGSQFALRIDNTDHRFQPEGTDSYLGGLRPHDYLADKIVLECGVTRADDSIEYIPVHTGYVEQLTYDDVSVNLDVVDVTMKMKVMQLAETISVTPRMVGSATLYTSRLADAASKIILAYVPGVTGGDFTGAWDALDELLLELDWIAMGTIESGATVYDGVRSLLSSAAAVMLPRADGTFHLASEWPTTFGSSVMPGRTLYPDVFENDRTATDFRYVVGRDLLCTEVVVDYGAEAAYRDTSDEARLGRITRRAAMPFVKFGRCARLGAYVLWLQNRNAPKVLAFTAGPPAMVIELDDRVQAIDVNTRTLHTYRVVGRQFQGGNIRLEVAREGHESSIIEGDFAVMGSDSWNGAADML